jgi:hypothetical protein
LTPVTAELRETFVERLESWGYTVTLDDFGVGINVIATLEGAKAPEELVVIGAHYDSTPGCSGADDNASGVAGALEAARVLAMAPHDRTLVIGLWDDEESGLRGSGWWAGRQAHAGAKVVVDYTFEMIGYMSTEPNSQQFPAGFELFFPDVDASLAANEYRGDFIALIAGDDTQASYDAMSEYGEQIGHGVEVVVLDESLRSSPYLPDLRRSDHGPFWKHGYPAIQITDTANFRYPGYHCGDGDDTVDRLDFDFARRTVAVTVFAAAMALAEAGPAATSPKAIECDLVAQDCPGGGKCALVLLNGFDWRPACVTPEADSTAATGELCERPTGEVGYDTCAPGGFCALWGLPTADPQTRQCFALCAADSDCGPDAACAAVDLALPNAGVCMERCDLFDGDACQDGVHCAVVPNLRDDDGRLTAGCWATAATPAGGACTGGCSDGLSCVRNPTTGEDVCQAPCDDDHPCAGGGACTPTATPVEGSPGVGFCFGG